MKIYFSLLVLFIFNCNSSAKPLNVLLFIVDDLRPSIGAYGDSEAVTPNINKLAQHGIIFQNAFAQQALCAPSRNSFLTSRRPDTLHLYDFNSYWRSSVGNFTTVPQYFKENSYYTKSIGKVFHPGNSSNFTDDYPYSWSVPAWHPPTDIYKNSKVCPTDKGYFANLICPVKLSKQPLKSLPDIQSAEEAVRFLLSVKKNELPFFLAVGFQKPHVPFKFPKKYADLHPLQNITLPGLPYYPPGLPTVSWNPWNDIRWREDIAQLNVSFPFGPFSEVWIRKLRQSYFACVSYIDKLIGDVLQGLKEAKLHKDTIVILLGDHGWSLGEHGEWSKYSNFEVAVRVPLIFRIPKITYLAKKSYKEGQIAEVKDPVELVDLFPTLVDLVGLEAVPKCSKDSSKIKLCSQGKSLMPLIDVAIKKKKSFQRDTPNNEWEKYALSQYPRPSVYPTKSPDSDRPKLHEIKFMGYSVRTQRYRYTEWITWDSNAMKGNWSNVNQTEFYDHHIDPEENLNLFGRPGLEDVGKMLARLLRIGFEADV